MLRKLLVPMLATAMLAGCATDYRYRAGNGDYYYGQPRVEYRYQGPAGYYDGYFGSFGLGYGFGGYGYDARYYYDPFGRLVYGYPGRYPYGNNGYQQRPRPHRDHDGHTRNDDDDRDGDSDRRHDRRPPWRALGGLQPHDGGNGSRDDADHRPRVQQRSAPSPAPVIRQTSEPSPRSGGFSRGGARVRSESSGESDE